MNPIPWRIRSIVPYFIALASLLLTTFAFSEEDNVPENLFPSNPEQVAALASESSYLVGGLISPLSGQPVIRPIDLIVRGAQNIVLSRIYIPPYIPCQFSQHKVSQEEYDKKDLYLHLWKHYRGWQFYPHLRLEWDPSLMEIRLADPSGAILAFHFSDSGFSLGSLYAISNVATDKPGGQYDPRNIRISRTEEKITVQSPEGTCRVYRKQGRITKTSYLYLLEKEILPNGKVLKYHYTDRKEPCYVESMDPQERYVYASLRIRGSQRAGFYHFLSSSGLVTDYSYEKRAIKWKLQEKVHHTKKEEKYKVFFPPLLTSASSPSYQHESSSYSSKFLLSSYNGKENLFKISYNESGEGPSYKVDKLFFPVGEQDAFAAVYEFSYDPPIAGQKEGSTVVRDCDGTSIIYHFSSHLLPKAIQYIGQDGNIKKEKMFFWDENQRLLSLELCDGEKNILYRKTYEYDCFGNPIVEAFTGDLIGEGNLETILTRRTFSKDGRNLLLREETEDGKVICFSYLPNTNLVTSKLTKDRDQIILREFSIYDDCHNLIKTILDDGIEEDKDNLSQVRQRLITTYTLRQSAPFLHMPEWIEETYLEEGCEKPLKKKHLIYDQHGNVAQEEVYDAEGSHAYTICKVYNERGDVLSETNRLGQEATYTYDARGRLETSLNFSKRLQHTFHYDAVGRVKTQIETGDDGIVHEMGWKYDAHGRKIQKKDSFENTTQYAYDPIANEIAKTDFPPIASIDGQAVSVFTFSTYDPFGRQLSKTDANGNTTSYRYNTYGSPVEIIYPNGGRESFRYTKNGELHSHTDLDGLTILYKRDILSRILSKTYITSDGNAIAEETFSYSGFHLLTETDKEGNIKEYSYDGAGRKIQEKFSRHVYRS